MTPNIYRYKGWWRVRWSGKDELDARAAGFVYRLNFLRLMESDWAWSLITSFPTIIG